MHISIWLVFWDWFYRTEIWRSWHCFIALRVSCIRNISSLVACVSSLLNLLNLFKLTCFCCPKSAIIFQWSVCICNSLGSTHSCISTCTCVKLILHSFLASLKVHCYCSILILQSCIYVAASSNFSAAIFFQFFFSNSSSISVVCVGVAFSMVWAWLHLTEL